ncbi:Crp/Fnr family transcriptional regulator [Actinomadura harenae]|uniref:Crp/Fnr family transcriptional regulator n=1 Tax=Actinomadura harenae TaxID=2483351 RepID=A0A3M2M8C6_9ACTN|nr:Crp/Fnr family transcriptional regulator [Actinomadura harenae]RMI45761.1 Crp/Fnr family transcriptional regulator [Actinomadura harenae]
MNVTDESWQRLLKLATARSCPSGSTLLRQGDPPTHVLALATGRVKIVRSSAEGDDLVLAVRGPGEILGDYSVLGQDDRSATVIAIEPCTTYAIPADRFLAFVRTSGLEADLLRHAMARIRESEAWRAELAALPARTRLARTLLRFGAGPSGAIGLDQTEIAGATGLARSTAAGELAYLREHGIVTTARRRVVITDPDALRHLARSIPPNV